MPDPYVILYDPKQKAEIEARCTCAWAWGFNCRGQGVRSHIGWRDPRCPMHGKEATNAGR